MEVICKTLFFRQEAQNSNQSLHTWQKLKPDIKTGLTGYKSSCYITDFTFVSPGRSMYGWKVTAACPCIDGVWPIYMLYSAEDFAGTLLQD